MNTTLLTALALGGPFAIRYPRGAAEGVPLPEEPQVLEVAQACRDGCGSICPPYPPTAKPQRK